MMLSWHHFVDHDAFGDYPAACSMIPYQIAIFLMALGVVEHESHPAATKDMKIN